VLLSTNRSHHAFDRSLAAAKSIIVRSFLLLIALVAVVLPSSNAYAYYCGCTDTAAKGQQRINQGQYSEAIDIFTCVINDAPTEAEGYRGRIEAKLMLGRFSSAMRDYARVTANVLPVHPTTTATIFADYDARLTAQPSNVPALTGASFAHWWYFDYEAALPLLDDLLAIRPSDVYGNLFRGSNRLFAGVEVEDGEDDIDMAIGLAPWSADVRFIVSDAYTYAQPDPDRALYEGTLAYNWGLDTPRVHAILASAYAAKGQTANAASQYQQHINLVTTQTVNAGSLALNGSVTANLAPGKTYEVSIAATAGQTLSIRTSSPSFEIWDSILVVLGPNGTPITGSDDYIDYYAGLDWVVPTTGTYKMRVTSFEGVGTGQLVVNRN
jgi:tetratricopeptide (TPR) repeat protein